jgi:thiamine transporter
MIHGFVQLVLFPWVLNPFQVIMDYPLPFGCVGLAGLVKKNPSLGVVFGMFGRFLCHYFSGIIFWYSMSSDVNNCGPWIYSAFYNKLYIVPETIITIILMYLLYQRDVFNLSL